MANENAQVDIKFNQPDGKVHRYESEQPNEGYVVERNEDKKTWTASGPDGVITNEAKSRAQAYEAVKQIAQGATPETAIAAATSDAAPKPLISAREHQIIQAMKEQGGEVGVADLVKSTGLDIALVMGSIASLARRKFVTLGANGSQVTESGETAFASYTPPVKKAARERGESGTRKNAMLEKYGPRPEGIGEPPTDVEYEQARLNNALASHEYTLVLQRRHPYSDIIKKKLVASTARVNDVKWAVHDAIVNENNIRTKNGQPLLDVPDMTGIERVAIVKKADKAAAEAPAEAPAE